MSGEPTEPRILSPGEPSGRRRAWIGATLVAGLLVAVGIVALIGGFTATRAPISGPGAGTDEGNVRPRSGSERTRRGAVRAAVSYAGAFGADQVVGPARFAELVDAIATPELAARLRSQEDAAQSTSGTRELQAAAQNGAIFAQSVPLAYRMVSYRGTRAVIDLWELSVLSGGSVAPFARFQRSLSTLEWRAGGWKLSRLGRPRGGPTPAIERGTATDSSRAFVGTLSRYTELRSAP
jgi:hypothetical protein